jgi:4-amino-4-deoxy-L-arabinose transferase-like glycosyltransferase
LNPTRRTAWLVLALLLAVFAARLLHTADAKSFTADEPHYIGTGLYLWNTGDYHWYSTLKLHPPLTFHLASLPLLFMDLGDSEPSPGWGAEILKGSSPSPQAVRFASRLPFIALACWGAVLVFLFAREVAGPGAGLLAGFLFTTSPDFLAHGALVSSDLVVSVCFVQALYAFWRWWQEPNLARLTLCGVAVGLVLIAKMQAVLLPLAMIGMVAVLAVRPIDRPNLAARSAAARFGWAVSVLAGVAAVSVATIAAGYGGSFASTSGAPGPLEEWMLPGWIRPLLFDWYFNQVDRTFFVLGRFSSEGAWWFLPLGFLVKTPIATLLLFAAAWLLPRSSAWRDARLGLFLGVPAAVYLVVAVFWLRLPMGVRYVLPLYPLLFVFIATRWIPLRHVAEKIGLAAACAWIAVTGLLVHPHYLAYFNEAAGGPSGGHRFFVESNLDWGQDLGTLAHTLALHGNPPVHIAYFGKERPASYGIRAVPLRGCAPVTGWVAISANVRAGLYDPANWFEPPPRDCHAWLAEHEPVATPGHSIFVYHLPGS